MGRWIMRLTALIILALGGWWWLATTGLERGMTAFWDSQQADGLEVSLGDTKRAGFPLRIAATQRDVTITDPTAQKQINLPAYTLSSPIYWPGDATLSVPSAAPITVNAPQGVFTLTSGGMQAAIKLHPGTALELEAVQASGSQLSLDLVEGRVFSVDDLQAEATQTSDPLTYDIDLTATGLALGSVIRQGLQMPVSWPDAFEPVVADMTVTFDRHWNRSALTGARPQPRRIQIDQLTAVWSEIGIEAKGDLDVSAQGELDGKLSLKVQNWQRVFDMAVATTQIPPKWRSTVEQVLGAMADADGTLDLPITMSGGQMRVGFFPLGPSPRLILR